VSAFYTFRLGDHGLAKKRGHCMACSQVEATIKVKAGSLEGALAKANEVVAEWTVRYGSTAKVEVTFQGRVTKRQLVREEASA